MPEKTFTNLALEELHDGDVIVGTYDPFNETVTVKRSVPYEYGAILRIKTGPFPRGVLAQVVERVGDNYGKGSWMSTRPQKDKLYLSDADVDNMIANSGGFTVLVEGSSE
jgi:hypothetical protein